MNVSHCLTWLGHSENLIKRASTDAKKIFFGKFLDVISRVCDLNKFLIEVVPLYRSRTWSYFLCKE